jgi:hypothetical protein
MHVFFRPFPVQSMEKFPRRVPEIEEWLAVFMDEEAFVIADLEAGRTEAVCDTPRTKVRPSSEDTTRRSREWIFMAGRYGQPARATRKVRFFFWTI